MLVGEAPGQEEAARGRPFVGKTGREQDDHLARNGFDRRDFYITNLRKQFIPGNPAPTAEDIKRWGPVLEEEINAVQPRFILAVGAHAVRFFLGESAHLEAVHGIPHKIRRGDREMVVVPGYHPAAHFYAPDLLQFIVYDYARFAAAVRGQIPLHPATDQFPDPEYIDGDDRDLDRYADCDDLAYDTEGYPGNVWSFQVTGVEGQGLVIRSSNQRFPQAVKAFRRLVKGKRLIGHNQLYELEMFRSIGLDLLDPILRVRFWDTMMAAYLHCIEPQSLKNLARRHCGMVMDDYLDTVGPAGRQKQLDYLEKIWLSDFPKPESRIEHNNDATFSVYTPQTIQRTAEGILVDVYSRKKNKDGEEADPFKRWKKVDRPLRLAVEARFGPMPIGTLADIPLKKAIRYAGRDPDATFRVARHLEPSLKTQKLTDLMRMKMAMYPAAAEMKLNGFLASRKHFEWLSEQMLEEMDLRAIKISKKFYKGRPFNPNSPDQVATLLRRRGLEAEKRTETGKVSTAKKSIEHFRYEDEAVELVEQWRERAKIRDSFSEVILETFPSDAEFYRVMGDLKMTRVSSGRFSMADPNLLAIPVRTELGRMVRQGFVASPGYMLGTWDLDQVEMRVMADESRDASLIKIFREGKIDVHTDTAATIFGLDYDELDADKKLRKSYRDPAKRANFGVITGIQGPGLYDQLRMAGAKGWSVQKCDRLIRDVLNLRPGIKAYMEECGEECARNGGVIRDRWQMPRYLPQILSDDKYERWEAKRQSHSHKIQGGAQGLIQTAMGWIYPRLKKYGDLVRWILQVHDEILLEVHESVMKEVDEIMIEGLTKHGATLRVPVKSKGSYGPNWAALEK